MVKWWTRCVSLPLILPPISSSSSHFCSAWKSIFSTTTNWCKTFKISHKILNMRISTSWSSTCPPTWYVCKSLLFQFNKTFQENLVQWFSIFFLKIDYARRNALRIFFLSFFVFVRQVVHLGLGHSKGMLVNAFLYHYMLPTMWYAKPFKTYSKNRKTWWW